MKSRTKKNIHRRENKLIRKEWRKWCYEVANSQNEEMDFIIEKNPKYFNPYQTVI